jgi:hypothetical protein
MPQLVREARYFSHCEQGVEMGESINLRCQRYAQRTDFGRISPVAALDVVIITAYNPSVTPYRR